jgi:hypothetical protein
MALNTTKLTPKTLFLTLIYKFHDIYHINTRKVPTLSATGIMNQLPSPATDANSRETRANAMADRQAAMSEAFDTAQCEQSLHIKNTKSFSRVL